MVDLKLLGRHRNNGVPDIAVDHKLRGILGSGVIDLGMQRQSLRVVNRLQRLHFFAFWSIVVGISMRRCFLEEAF